MTAPAALTERKPSPGRSKYCGARVVTALRNQERKMHANGNGHRALTLAQMKEAVTADASDRYRDWAGAYWADVRRGWGGNRSRVSATLLVSTRTPVPRPLRDRAKRNSHHDATPTALTILRVGPTIKERKNE